MNSFADGIRYDTYADSSTFDSTHATAADCCHDRRLRLDHRKSNALRKCSLRPCLRTRSGGVLHFEKWPYPKFPLWSRVTLGKTKSQRDVLITGWCFGTCFYFFPSYIGNVIIPTDFWIFQRGRLKPPTIHN